MKYFIKTFFLFLFFTSITYILLILVLSFLNLPQSLTPNLIKRDLSTNTFIDIQKVKKIDILFIGSSHAYRGFDVRLFEKYGYKVFNLGTTAQSPVDSKLLLNYYIDQLTPKIVVFDAFPLLFSKNENNIEAKVSIIANLVDNKLLYTLINQDILTNMKILNTTITTYINNKYFKIHFFKKAINDELYIKNGYITFDNLKYNSVIIKNRNYLNIDKEKFKEVAEIKNVLKKKGIKFLILQMPMTNKFYSSFDSMQALDHMISKNIKYYNFNFNLKLNDSIDFYDSHHLNQNGVLKTNQYLIKILDSINL